jgi:arylsulfatase A-like enzyme
VAAEEYRQLYDESLIPLPKNYLPLHPFNNGDMDVRDERLAPWPRTESEVRRQLRDYYSVISAMDRHIGRLLDKVEQLGLSDNTIVIYSADHGLGMGSHGLMGKQSLYDTHMKPPLIFAGPGIQQGKSAALVYLMDIFPTVCDLVGAPIPAGLDGRSFAGVLRGTTTQARDRLFLAYRDVQRAIRDDRWKLIRYPQVNITQLFDLEHDPDEMHNLADASGQDIRVAAMLAEIRQAQQHYGDTCPLEVEHPQDPRWTPPAK